MDLSKMQFNSTRHFRRLPRSLITAKLQYWIPYNSQANGARANQNHALTGLRNGMLDSKEGFYASFEYFLNRIIAKFASRSMPPSQNQPFIKSYKKIILLTRLQKNDPFFLPR